MYAITQIASTLFFTALVVVQGCGGSGDSASGESSASENVQPPGSSAVAHAENVIPYRVDGTLSFSRGGESIKTIGIEIADTDSSRSRGMMQRESIPKDWGMLFVFSDEEERAFWMANTPEALDLMFINGDSTIIKIARYVQPMSAETIPSDGPAKYVLEVEAGYSDTIGVIEGDRVTWSRGEGKVSEDGSTL